MKKLFLVLIPLVALGFSSCKKCGTCTITTVTSVNQQVTGYPQTTTSTVEECGDDYKDLKDNGTATSTTTVQGISATTTTTTTYIDD